MSRKCLCKVQLPDGSWYEIKSLLTRGEDNTKLKKSNKHAKYETVGLSLAPHKISGYNVCPNSTSGCRKGCIFFAGCAQVWTSILRARTAKTIAFFQHREWFLVRLDKEIELAKRRAAKKGKVLALRLNVFSDIAWEKVAPDLFAKHFDVQGYDYTKVVGRALKALKRHFPLNYHLTFSRSELNERDCLRVLRAGGNVAVVFDRASKGNLPKTWKGYPVVNGDQDDLRFLGPRGVVIGLYAKGLGRYDTTGFVVRTKLTTAGRAVACQRRSLPVLQAA